LRVHKNWSKHFRQKPKPGFSMLYYGLSKLKIIRGKKNSYTPRGYYFIFFRNICWKNWILVSLEKIEFSLSPLLQHKLNSLLTIFFDPPNHNSNSNICRLFVGICVMPLLLWNEKSAYMVFFLIIIIRLNISTFTCFN
jgi:hypothetical protein